MATRRTGCWCATTARRPISRTTPRLPNWIKLGRGFRARHRHLGRRSPRLRAAREGGARHTGAGSTPCSTCCWCDSRFCIAARKARDVTRSDEFVTLRELRGQRSPTTPRPASTCCASEQHMDFDLDLAKSARSNDNPVFSVNYAHARVYSVFRQLKEKGFTRDRARGSMTKKRQSPERAPRTGVDGDRWRPTRRWLKRGARARTASAGVLPALTGERLRYLLQRPHLYRRKRRGAARYAPQPSRYLASRF